MSAFIFQNAATPTLPAFRRKNNCSIYSDNAGVRWWFKYRDEPAFELPPSIIDKYRNNILPIRDVMEYRVKHRE